MWKKQVKMDLKGNRYRLQNSPSCVFLKNVRLNDIKADYTEEMPLVPQKIILDYLPNTAMLVVNNEK